MTCCAYSCTQSGLYTQYMLLSHADDLLCLQLHTVRSPLSPPLPHFLRFSFNPYIFFVCLIYCKLPVNSWCDQVGCSLFLSLLVGELLFRWMHWDRWVVSCFMLWNDWLQLGLFINESDISLHSAVDPNFSFVVCDTFYAFFFLLRATFEMFCKWSFVVPCWIRCILLYVIYVRSLILDGRSSSVVFWIVIVKKKKKRKYYIINSELGLTLPVIVVPKIWIWLKCDAERNIFACDLQSWWDHFWMLSYMKKNTEKGYNDTNICVLSDSQAPINPLVPELFFLILAHSVYKMWIIQEPNKLALWNKLHFEEKKKTESIDHV